MAVVILGGLVTSTLLTVVVLPALYLRFGFVAEQDASAEDLSSVSPTSTRSEGRRSDEAAAVRPGRSVRSSALILAACGGAVSDEYASEEQPYTVETVDGERGSAGHPDRVRGRTARHRDGPSSSRGATSWSCPYDAVFIDAHGDFWVYTNPEPLVFVRAPIDIVRETSDRGVPRRRPAGRTQVVTVGVPELYGTETGFGT